MHEHKICEHDFKYCKVCDVVYCEKCKVEWSRVNWSVYYGSTQPLSTEMSNNYTLKYKDNTAHSHTGS